MDDAIEQGDQKIGLHFIFPTKHLLQRNCWSLFQLLVEVLQVLVLGLNHCHELNQQLAFFLHVYVEETVGDGVELIV